MIPAADSPPARRPRLFIYGMNYAPELIGVGRYSGELGAYMARSADVEVVTTAPHYPGWQVQAPYRAFAFQKEMRDGALVHRCPMLMRKEMRGTWRILAPLSFAFFSAPLALWRILRTRPDTVLAVEPTLGIAPVAVLGAWLTGARAVLHVQDLEVDAAFAVGHLSGGLPRRFALFCERVLLSCFDHVVTISSEMRSRLQAKGVRDNRLSVVRNWVDLGRIRPLPRENGFRRELGLAEADCVALYAGNIGAKQALHVVLEAAQSLSDEPGLVFVIAGEGPEKARLQARYGHLRNVRYLPLQPEERLCELLNLADVHLLPQDRNAADLVLPSKLGGMLATGRDILVATEPGTELHSFLAGSAIVVPSGDTVAMAEALRRRARAGMHTPIAPNPLVFMLDTAENLAKFAALLLLPKG